MLWRFIIYTLAITAFCALLPWTIADGDVQEFTENRWVEWLQLALILGSSGLLLVTARRAAGSGELLMLIAGLYAIAAFRELDAVLELLVPWLGWKIGPALLSPLLLGLLIVRAGRVRGQFDAFLGTPAFVLGWAGFMMVVPIAQLIGHGPFLEAMLGDHYHRAYKHAIEESAELIGYMMLAAAAVEAAFKRPSITEGVHGGPRQHARC